MKDANPYSERLTIWIDGNVKHQAKLKALANQVTLSAVIEDLLSRYVKGAKHDVGKEGKRVNE